MPTNCNKIVVAQKGDTCSSFAQDNGKAGFSQFRCLHECFIAAERITQRFSRADEMKQPLQQRNYTRGTPS